MLVKNVSDYKEFYDSAVSKFITNDFYVDDGLPSFETISQAIQMIKDARDVRAKEDIHLHKFVSNSHQVIDL